ncbi:hypothetical protein [Paeniglutamicibacter sp. NPDC091659]|uniref:hypothetical protein n=1 Tax=Paeniglutamicibacter sp. NPDC091659 TaxID=3364389 RepID=UPI0037F84276
MKKNQKRTIVATSIAALTIGCASFGVLSAANSEPFTLPTDLQEGVAVASENPVTQESVKTDQFDNVAKKPGEAAGLVDEESQETLFSISVKNIRTSQGCPSRVPEMNLTPERKTFLILDVEATMSAKVGSTVEDAKDNELYMPLIAEAFSVSDKSGNIERNVSSQSAWGCFDESLLIPAVVNAGESVHGKVVLDTSHISGKVVYDPENNGGWSWPIGTN